MRWSIIALTFALLVSPASADEFVSSDFGFSADFPAPVEQSAPTDSERDGSGNAISKLVTFASTVRGVYFCAVAVDSYFVATRLNVAASLASERDAYLREFNGFATSTTNHAVGGHPAMQFAFDTPNGGIRGRGLVILIQSPMPRIYMLVTAHGPQASASHVAALNQFYSSFRLTR